MKRTTYAALFIIACFLITAILEKQWQEPQHRGTQPLTARKNAEAAAPGFSMPCTWICQGSEIKCAQIANRQCVNADRSE